MNEKVTANGAPAEETQDQQEVSKVKRIINTVVNVILVIAILMAAICTYISYVSTSGSGVPNILGTVFLTVQSDSMYPEIHPGDLIIDTPVKDPSELRQGDIITYWTIINGERVLNTHRIHNIYDGGDYLLFETKGERNTVEDPLTVHESEIVGKYKFSVRGIGKALDYLQTPTGFFLIIVLPVLLFFVFHLVQFFRVLFEYQNVKMLIKYEQERGRTEDLIASQIKDEKEQEEVRRAAMEAEIRAQLKAELMAKIANKQKESKPAPEPTNDGEKGDQG